MQGHRSSLAVATALLLLVASPTFAQGHGGGHGGPGMYFDPETIVTVAGALTVDNGDWMPWGNGNFTGGGMGFEIRTDEGETLELMLAPAWFLQDAGISLGSGERVTVTGSRVEPYDGGHGMGMGRGGMMGGDDDYLIATVLVADGIRLALRDADGYPLWRGGPEWDDHWFDPDTIVTLDGVLGEELGMWGAWGNGNHTGSAMHFLFAAEDGETYYAMLGPWWFLEDGGLALAPGDAVRIRGSVVDSYWGGYADHPYLVATEITAGGITVQLRDDWGYPLWHGTGWYYDCPAWDPDGVDRLAGRVVRIRHRTHGHDLDRGTEILLDTGRATLVLYVAPDWAVEALGIDVRRGDELEVLGSVVPGRRRDAMLAEQIAGPAGRWRLRTRSGDPIWVAGIH